MEISLLIFLKFIIDWRSYHDITINEIWKKLNLNIRVNTMAAKNKYLNYLEDTRKHHSEIDKVAKISTKKAIAASHRKSVPVTFMEGENIVKVGPEGNKLVVGMVKIIEEK